MDVLAVRHGPEAQLIFPGEFDAVDAHFDLLLVGHVPDVPRLIYKLCAVIPVFVLERLQGEVTWADGMQGRCRGGAGWDAGEMQGEAGEVQGGQRGTADSLPWRHAPVARSCGYISPVLWLVSMSMVPLAHAGYLPH